MPLPLILYPPKKDWINYIQRPFDSKVGLEDAVKSILTAVKEEGDEALIRFTNQWDCPNLTLSQLKVSEEELKSAEKELPVTLVRAIREAIRAVRIFHEAQKSTAISVETYEGVVCEQVASPIEKVGLYIPGGTSPLFSTVIMLAVPAKIAGCSEITLCSPPNKEGKIHPAILFAAKECGVDFVYRCGGAQAVAALAFGTEQIGKVDKIFGPGNAYVTAAKQMVSHFTAVDMPAGPSEVLVSVDEDCPDEFAAWDLLAQAEHGPDSQVLLITYSEEKALSILKKIEGYLDNLPKANYALQSLKAGYALVFSSQEEAISFSNLYAPEHLIVAEKNVEPWRKGIKHAGSVFLGYFSPESAGDYASGTNHTLPTSGFARSFSGVNLDSFQKKITFQTLNKAGVQSLCGVVTEMAKHEELEAHRMAMQVRMDYLNKI